jgi:hypothetical protein
VYDSEAFGRFGLSWVLVGRGIRGETASSELEVGELSSDCPFTSSDCREAVSVSVNRCCAEMASGI